MLTADSVRPCIGPYHRNDSARSNTATEAHPPLVVWVLPPSYEVLVPHVVGAFIYHEAAALHLNGVAAAEVGVQVCAVITALITTTLKVSVLVKDNLQSPPNGGESGISRVQEEKLQNLRGNDSGMQLVVVCSIL